MEIESNQNKQIDHEEEGSVPSEEIEIAGGDQIAEEIPEESQNEIERLEKLETEKQKFIQEIQDSKTDVVQDVKNLLFMKNDCLREIILKLD